MPDPLPIKNEIIILCEGLADQNFIRKLIMHRGGFPPIDFLPADRFHGRDAFGEMIQAIIGTGVAFERLKGILIVADSHNNPASTLTLIQRQIRRYAPEFPVPEQLLTPSILKEGYPRSAIMLLPDETNPGPLESLFARELEAKTPWVTECVDAFLQCARIQAHAWPPEKHAKARYHSIVAAVHKADPSRSVSAAFTNRPAVMDIGSTTFDSVETRIRDFCAAIGVTA